MEPYSYLDAHPGKEVRSQLIAAFNHWLCVPAAKLEQIRKVVRMLHTASLLMDDVEDNSDLRRGIPVAHRIYGVPQTINTANYVYFLAMDEVARLLATPAPAAAGSTTPSTNIPADTPLPRPWNAERFVVQEMIHLHRGQGMDLFWRDSLVCPTEREYVDMVCNKTGGLFRIALKLMIANSPLYGILAGDLDLVSDSDADTHADAQQQQEQEQLPSDVESDDSAFSDRTDYTEQLMDQYASISYIGNRWDWSQDMIADEMDRITDVINADRKASEQRRRERRRARRAERREAEAEARRERQEERREQRQRQWQRNGTARAGTAAGAAAAGESQLPDFLPLADLIGLIFQIRDDYMNLQSKQYEDNKGFAEDLTEGKFSFPIIHAIRSSGGPVGDAPPPPPPPAAAGPSSRPAGGAGNSRSSASGLATPPVAPRPLDERSPGGSLPPNRQILNVLKQRPTDLATKKYAVQYMRDVTGSFAYTRTVLGQLDRQASAEVERIAHRLKQVRPALDEQGLTPADGFSPAQGERALVAILEKLRSGWQEEE